MKIALFSKLSICLMALTCYQFCTAQNQYGNSILCGHFGIVAEFTDTLKPILRSTNNNQPMILNPFGGHSSISDSNSGKPLLFCDGFRLTDSSINLILNGDSLVSSQLYTFTNYSTISQSSLILPVSNHKYYIFNSNVTDSAYSSSWISANQHFDQLLYHLVDMNANNGNGEVVKKNQLAIYNIKLNLSQLQACQHGNGKDWWVIKPGYKSNIFYTIKVTDDSVYAPIVQTFVNTINTSSTHWGQISFNNKGDQFAMVTGTSNELILLDFDRCTGILSHFRSYPIPIDSSTLPNTLQAIDSACTGVCFSPNDSLIYVSKKYNIYQFNPYSIGGNGDWYRVKHGPDTSLLAPYSNYGPMYLGPDERLYIGPLTPANPPTSNVINKPNLIGVQCDYCNRCLRYNIPTLLSSFANMPNYNMGPVSTNCWPNGVTENEKEKLFVEVYPNPSNGNFSIRTNYEKNFILVLSDILGRVQFEAGVKPNHNPIEINLINKIHRGLYVFRMQDQVGKTIYMGKLIIEYP